MVWSALIESEISTYQGSNVALQPLLTQLNQNHVANHQLKHKGG